MPHDHGRDSKGTSSEKKGKKRQPRPIETVLLSGGAPNSPLMAGFLYALLNEGKMFREYHTAGAGTLMALLSLAPKQASIARCEDPDAERTEPIEQRLRAEGKQLSDNAKQVRARGMKALRSWIDAGVADEVYQRFPVNFKLFHKPGPFAPLFSELAQRYKLDEPGPASDDPFKRLREAWLGRVIDTPERRRIYNDVVDLAFAAITPSTLTTKSKGLAAHLPFLEEIVDFDFLQNEVPVHLCVNAFNMAKGEMEEFHRPEIDGRHIRAAFSMPFIYPPAQIGTDYYSEGADHEPINFNPLIRQREEEWKRKEEALFAQREEMLRAYEALTARFHETGQEIVRLNEERVAPECTAEMVQDIVKQVEKHQKRLRELGDRIDEAAERLREAHREIDVKIAESHVPHRVVLLDVMGSLSPYLVRPPRGLWDAYVISIMTPVVALAKKCIEHFKATQEIFERDHGYRHFELIELGFDIPSYARPYVMDWSRSNLETLFDVGRKTGERFIEDYGAGALVDIDDAWHAAPTGAHAAH